MPDDLFFIDIGAAMVHIRHFDLINLVFDILSRHIAIYLVKDGQIVGFECGGSTTAPGPALLSR